MTDAGDSAKLVRIVLPSLPESRSVWGSYSRTAMLDYGLRCANAQRVADSNWIEQHATPADELEEQKWEGLAQHFERLAREVRRDAEPGEPEDTIALNLEQCANSVRETAASLTICLADQPAPQHTTPISATSEAVDWKGWSKLFLEWHFKVSRGEFDRGEVANVLLSASTFAATIANNTSASPHPIERQAAKTPYVNCANPECPNTFGGYGYGEWPKVCPDCQDKGITAPERQAGEFVANELMSVTEHLAKKKRFLDDWYANGDPSPIPRIMESTSENKVKVTDEMVDRGVAAYFKACKTHAEDAHRFIRRILEAAAPAQPAHAELAEKLRAMTAHARKGFAVSLLDDKYCNLIEQAADALSAM